MLEIRGFQVILWKTKGVKKKKKNKVEIILSHEGSWLFSINDWK